MLMLLCICVYPHMQKRHISLLASILLRWNQGKYWQTMMMPRHIGVYKSMGASNHAPVWQTVCTTCGSTDMGILQVKILNLINVCVILFHAVHWGKLEFRNNWVILLPKWRLGTGKQINLKPAPIQSTVLPSMSFVKKQYQEQGINSGVGCVSINGLQEIHFTVRTKIFSFVSIEGHRNGQ